jgi:F-type H+-transporting ATPase subunit gamma
LANLKDIRKRIGSVKSTQKITRAMKMVAGARLNRAQQRILALRPYVVKTASVLSEVTEVYAEIEEGAENDVLQAIEAEQPMLSRRPEKSVLFLVITSDRGLCGSFNASINKEAQRAWTKRRAAGQRVQVAVIGRKGRDFVRRRDVDVAHVFERVWDRLDLEQARVVARTLLRPFLAAEVDSIYMVYNEFKSAMTQRVVVEPLLPVQRAIDKAKKRKQEKKDDHVELSKMSREFIFEPDRRALLAHLVPMYVEVSILRALYESMASELGARMTAMDAATKNASEMIDKLTLKYNRARQAAITTELMEIIGGANALQD